MNQPTDANRAAGMDNIATAMLIQAEGIGQVKAVYDRLGDATQEEADAALSFARGRLKVAGRHLEVGLEQILGVDV